MSDSEDSSLDSSEDPGSASSTVQCALKCACERTHPLNGAESDDEDADESFSRATDDTCWVPISRLGTIKECDSADLVTVTDQDDASDVKTLCREHLKAIRKHHCCHYCFTLVEMGTFLECPAGHRTDPMCRELLKRAEAGEARSCSHCDSTDLRENQQQLELEDSDESHVTEFTKLIEELEKAQDEGTEVAPSLADQWKERMRAVAQHILIAFRHNPQKIEDLASRMYSVLDLVENEEIDLIEKLCDLRGVAKPGDIMPGVEKALESFYFEGELPFRYCDVVADPDRLTAIGDEKAIMFCECVDVCDPATCVCCSGKYETDAEGEIYLRADSLRAGLTPVSECGAACACRTTCGNRLVQAGERRYPLELIDTRDRGQGIRAKDFIPAGRFIAEYTGTLRAIGGRDQPAANDYCFETVLGLQRVEVDALAMGGAARCFNHSCEPNAVIVKVAWEPVEARRLFHLAIFALEDIEEAAEITIDYGDAFWLAKSSVLACACGSASCRHREIVKHEDDDEEEEENSSGILETARAAGGADLDDADEDGDYSGDDPVEDVVDDEEEYDEDEYEYEDGDGTCEISAIVADRSAEYEEEEEGSEAAELDEEDDELTQEISSIEAATLSYGEEDESRRTLDEAYLEEGSVAVTYDESTLQEDEDENENGDLEEEDEDETEILERRIYEEEEEEEEEEGREASEDGPTAAKRKKRAQEDEDEDDVDVEGSEA